MTDTQKKGSLSAALLAAQKAIRSPEKASKNVHGGYSYTSCEDMIAEARRALLGAGVVMHRAGWTYDRQQRMLTAGWIISHPESGDSAQAELQWPVEPHKGMPEDKALAAALSTSMSYWLRDLLMIPRGLAEGEVDQRDDSSYVPPERKSAPKAVRKSSSRVTGDYILAIADAQTIADLDAIAGQIKDDPGLSTAMRDTLRRAFVERRQAVQEDGHVKE